MQPQDTQYPIMSEEEKREQERALMREQIMAKYATAQDDSAVQQARSDAASQNKMSGIFEGLEGIGRANSVSRGGARTDSSFYEGQRAAAANRVKDAQAAQKGRVDAVTGELAMTRDLNQEDRAAASAGYEKDRADNQNTEFAQKTQTFNAETETRKNENNPNSPESQAAQKAMSLFNGGKIDPTLTATQFKSLGPTQIKAYELQLTRDNNNAKNAIDRDRLTLDGRKLDAEKAKPLPMSVGSESADREFGKRYAEYSTGGFARGNENIKKLEGVVARIGAKGIPKSINEKEDVLQAKYTGALPMEARAAMDPLSVEIQQEVESVAQEAMKEILGAQFAATEGRELLKRTWNPQLPTEVNVQRVTSLITKLRDANNAMMGASKHWEANGGSLGSYKMPMFSTSDEGGGDEEAAARARQQELLNKSKR